MCSRYYKQPTSLRWLNEMFLIELAMIVAFWEISTQQHNFTFLILKMKKTPTKQHTIMQTVMYRTCITLSLNINSLTPKVHTVTFYSPVWLIIYSWLALSVPNWNENFICFEICKWNLLWSFWPCNLISSADLVMQFNFACILAPLMLGVVQVLYFGGWSQGKLL